MKTTKRILAILLAALLMLGLCAISGNAAGQSLNDEEWDDLDLITNIACEEIEGKLYSRSPYTYLWQTLNTPALMAQACHEGVDTAEVLRKIGAAKALTEDWDLLTELTELRYGNLHVETYRAGKSEERIFGVMHEMYDPYVAAVEELRPCFKDDAFAAFAAYASDWELITDMRLAHYKDETTFTGVLSAHLFPYQGTMQGSVYTWAVDIPALLKAGDWAAAEAAALEIRKYGEDRIAAAPEIWRDSIVPGEILSGVNEAGEYWAVYGDFLLSSPDVDVSLQSPDCGKTGTVWFRRGNGSMLPNEVILLANGRYTLRLRSGIEFGTNTILRVDCNADLTLRDVRTKNRIVNYYTGSHPTFWNAGNQILSFCPGTVSTLRLVGENVFIAGDTYYDVMRPVVELRDNAKLTIEGPGSLTVDCTALVAWGSPFMPGIGQGGMYNTCNSKLTINGGTILAKGGTRLKTYSDGTWRGNSPAIGPGLDLAINGGNVTAIGGNAPGIDAVVQIKGGVVRASVDDSDFLRAYGRPSGVKAIEGGTGSAIQGNAVVFADTISDSVLLRQGIVFAGNTGTFYGITVAVTEDVAFPAGSSLTVPPFSTLAVRAGKTVESLGTLTNEGTIQANIYYEQELRKACAGYGALLNFDAPHEHDWGPWKVTTPATEDADGVETRVCRLDPNHTETRVIPAGTTTTTTPTTGSDWRDWPVVLQWIMRIFFFGFLWMK